MSKTSNNFEYYKKIYGIQTFEERIEEKIKNREFGRISEDKEKEINLKKKQEMDEMDEIAHLDTKRRLSGAFDIKGHIDEYSRKKDDNYNKNIFEHMEILTPEYGKVFIPSSYMTTEEEYLNADTNHILSPDTLYASPIKDMEEALGKMGDIFKTTDTSGVIGQMKVKWFAEKTHDYLMREATRYMAGLPNKLAVVQAFMAEHSDIFEQKNGSQYEYVVRSMEDKIENYNIHSHTLMGSESPGDDHKFLQGLSKTAYMLKRSVESGMDEAVAGGIAGGVMGTLAGMVAGPLGVFAVPVTAMGGFIAGAVAGMSQGAFSYMAQQEAGGAYLEYLAMGIDPDIARASAEIVGTINGLIELSEIYMIMKLPGVGKFYEAGLNKAKEAATKGMTKIAVSKAQQIYGTAIGKAAVIYATGLLGELGEEVSQEVITITWGEVSKMRQEARTGVAIDKITGKEVTSRLWETVRESYYALALMPAISMGVHGASSYIKTTVYDENKAFEKYATKIDSVLAGLEEAPIENWTSDQVKDMIGIINGLKWSKDKSAKNRHKEKINEYIDVLDTIVTEYFAYAVENNVNVKLLLSNYTEIQNQILSSEYNANDFINGTKESGGKRILPTTVANYKLLHEIGVLDKVLAILGENEDMNRQELINLVFEGIKKTVQAQMDVSDIQLKTYINSAIKMEDEIADRKTAARVINEALATDALNTPTLDKKSKNIDEMDTGKDLDEKPTETTQTEKLSDREDYGAILDDRRERYAEETKSDEAKTYEDSEADFDEKELFESTIFDLENIYKEKGINIKFSNPRLAGDFKDKTQHDRSIIVINLDYESTESSEKINKVKENLEIEWEGRRVEVNFATIREAEKVAEKTEKPISKERTYETSEVVKIPVKDINIDGETFQFRVDIENETARANNLKNADFNEDVSGTVLVYEDEFKDLYVVNGEYRVKLAKQSKQETINGKIITADNYTVQEARALGAMINIAEGSATSLDIAKLIRDSDTTTEELKGMGVSIESTLVQDGIALSNLHPSIFNRVFARTMPIKRGVAIGKQLADNQEAQLEVLKMLKTYERKGKAITNEVLTEIISFVKGSETIKGTQTDLFGTAALKKTNALERAELVSHVKNVLKNKKTLLKKITKDKNADILEKLGNEMDQDKNLKELNASEKLLYIIDNTVNYKGSVLNEIFNRLAKEYVNTKNKAEIKKKAVDEVSAFFESEESLETEGIKRTKTIPQVKTKAEIIMNKTINNLNKNPLLKKYNNTVLVAPVKTVEKYKGKSKTDVKETQEYKDLKKDIEENGIKEPLILEYNPETGYVLLKDENAQLLIAEELGLTHIPVRGVINTTLKEQKDGAVVSKKILKPDTLLKIFNPKAVLPELNNENVVYELVYNKDETNNTVNVAAMPSLEGNEFIFINEKNGVKVPGYDEIKNILIEMKKSPLMRNVTLEIKNEEKLAPKKKGGGLDVEGYEYFKGEGIITGEVIEYPDSKKRSIILYRGFSKDSIAEEIIHTFQIILETINPELAAEIKAWEKTVKEEALILGIEIPTGLELFAKAFVYGHLNHASLGNELTVGNLIAIPTDLLEKVKNHFGVNFIKALEGESSYIVPSEDRLLGNGIKLAATEIFINRLEQGYDDVGGKHYSIKKIAERFDSQAILNNKGILDFGDRKINSHEDLAVLAAAYRNPLYETTRTVYLKDGKVVFSEYATNRNPSFISNLHVAKETGYNPVSHTHKVANMVGADSFYRLHNHPGVLKVFPSHADTRTTKLIYDETMRLNLEKGKKEIYVDGVQRTINHIEFKGEIILDHNEYYFIDPTEVEFDHYLGRNVIKNTATNTGVKFLSNAFDDPFFNPTAFSNNSTRNKNIIKGLENNNTNTQLGMAMFGKAIFYNNDVAICFISDGTKINQVFDIDVSDMDDSEFDTLLHNLLEYNSGTYMSLAIPKIHMKNNQLKVKLEQLVKDGIIKDAIFVETDPNSIYTLSYRSVRNRLKKETVYLNNYYNKISDISYGTAYEKIDGSIKQVNESIYNIKTTDLTQEEFKVWFKDSKAVYNNANVDSLGYDKEANVLKVFLKKTKAQKKDYVVTYGLTEKEDLAYYVGEINAKFLSELKGVKTDGLLPFKIPMVTRYGTSEIGIQTFDIMGVSPNAIIGGGFYFTESAITNNGLIDERGGIHTTYISVQNPIDADNYILTNEEMLGIGITAEDINTMKEYGNMVFNTKNDFVLFSLRDVLSKLEVIDGLDRANNITANLINTLPALGYDGITYLGGFAEKHRTFSVFNERQIKPMGNSGIYSKINTNTYLNIKSLYDDTGELFKELIPSRFHLKSLEVVRDFFPNKIGTKSVKGFLGKRGIKPSELVILDIESLESVYPKSITKTELMKWIAAHNVDIREIKLDKRGETAVTYLGGENNSPAVTRTKIFDDFVEDMIDEFMKKHYGALGIYRKVREQALSEHSSPYNTYGTIVPLDDIKKIFRNEMIEYGIGWDSLKLHESISTVSRIVLLGRVYMADYYDALFLIADIEATNKAMLDTLTTKDSIDKDTFLDEFLPKYISEIKKMYTEKGIKNDLDLYAIQGKFSYSATMLDKSALKSANYSLRKKLELFKSAFYDDTKAQRLFFEKWRNKMLGNQFIPRDILLFVRSIVNVYFPDLTLTARYEISNKMINEIGRTIFDHLTIRSSFMSASKNLIGTKDIFSQKDTGLSFSVNAYDFFTHNASLRRDGIYSLNLDPAINEMYHFIKKTEFNVEGNLGAPIRNISDEAVSFSSYSLISGVREYNEYLFSFPVFDNGKLISEVLTSSHFSSENVAVHARESIYTDSNGTKYLLIEEVQSDYAQNKSRNDPNIFVPMTTEKQWIALCLQNAIAHAIEKGAKYVVWASGFDQTKRWEGAFAQIYDTVEVTREYYGFYGDFIYNLKGQRGDRTNLNERLYPDTNSDNVVTKSSFDRLVEHIGGTLANKAKAEIEEQEKLNKDFINFTQEEREEFEKIDITLVSLVETIEERTEQDVETLDELDFFRTTTVEEISPNEFRIISPEYTGEITGAVFNKRSGLEFNEHMMYYFSYLENLHIVNAIRIKKLTTGGKFEKGDLMKYYTKYVEPMMVNADYSVYSTFDYGYRIKAIKAEIINNGLVNDLKTETYDAQLKQKRALSNMKFIINEENFVVGTNFMFKLYDKTLPKIAHQYVKQYDSQVEDISVFESDVFDFKFVSTEDLGEMHKFLLAELSADRSPSEIEENERTFKEGFYFRIAKNKANIEVIVKPADLSSSTRIGNRYAKRVFTYERLQYLGIVNDLINLANEKGKAATETRQGFEISERLKEKVLKEKQSYPNIKRKNAGKPSFKNDLKIEKSIIKTLYPTDVNTKEFKAFFKDSVITKNGKPKGNPLVVYHNSAKEFSAFDMFKVGQENGTDYGRGIYFTDDYSKAKGYGDVPYSVYLRIENPIEPTQKKVTRNQWRKIANIILENDLDAFINYGEEKNMAINNFIEWETSDTPDIDVLAGMYNAGVTDTETINRAFVEVTGYDGVISKGYYDDPNSLFNIYVALIPEQIKSIYNRGSWDTGNNIYYSIKDKEKAIDTPFKEEHTYLIPLSEEPGFKARNAFNNEFGESSWGRTVENADVTDPELKSILHDISFIYEIKHNRNQILDAAEKIDAEGENAVVSWILSDNPLTDIMAVASILIMRMNQKRGNKVHENVALVESIDKKAITAGQAIQVLSLLGRLSPEGILRTATRMFEKSMNEHQKEDINTKSKKVEKEFRNINKDAVNGIYPDIEKELKDLKNMTPEEKLARRIKETLKDKKIKEDDPISIMVKTLFDVAKESLPESEKIAKDPMSFVVEAIINRAEYRDVWAKAKEIVTEHFKDDETALEKLNPYFEKAINRTFPDSKLESAIDVKLKDMSIKIMDLAKKHYTLNSEARKGLVNQLINEAELTEDEANILEKHIRRIMKEKTKKAKEKILASMFKKVVSKGPKNIEDRIIELSNLGAMHNASYKHLIAEKLGLPTLTPELMKFLNEKAELIQTLEVGSREQQVQIELMLSEIAAHIPLALSKKIAFLQTMAQLLNFKTTIRNIAGNVGFGVVLENVADIVASPIDVLAGLYWGEKTKVFNPIEKIKAQAKGMKKGWDLGLEDALLGIDTSHMGTKYGLPSGKVFKKGPLSVMETVMNILLRATDRASYQSAVEVSLYEQMLLADAEYPTMKMIEQAHVLGLYRTFQDDNMLSHSAVQIKHALNCLSGIITGQTNFGLGDFVLKYPKTPANLLARGLEYSPVGFVETAVALYRNTSADNYTKQKIFVDGTSRAFTGSMVIATGVTLANLGLITGTKNEDEDWDVYRIKQDAGFKDYSINVTGLRRYLMDFNPESAKLQPGDKLMTYDWYQPTSIGIALGVNLYENSATVNLSVLNQMLSSIEAGTTTLTEQPLLSGLKTLFGQEDISSATLEVLKGVISSFVPTAFSQAQIAISPIRYMATDNTSYFKTTVNNAARKIPGAGSRYLPTYYTKFGDVATYYDDETNVIKRVIDSFISPSISSKYDPDPETALVLKLLENVPGSEGIVPDSPRRSYTLNDGTKIILTPSQYAELSKFVGEEARKAYGHWIERGIERKKEEVQVQLLKDELKKINKKAKELIEKWYEEKK